jgi:hypothetical protein
VGGSGLRPDTAGLSNPASRPTTWRSAAAEALCGTTAAKGRTRGAGFQIESWPLPSGTAARSVRFRALIAEWAGKLKGAGGERRLQKLVTFWFAQASFLASVTEAYEEGRVRDFVNRRLAQGASPDAIALPKHFHRVDRWLPEIAERLTTIRSELLALPGDVVAALKVRFGEYDRALEALAALPVMLNTIAATWYRPSPGHPSLERMSDAVGLLILAVEDFTEEQFRSPHSYKRLDEIEFVRLLAGRLFPSATRAEIDTMLRHFHKQRLSKTRAGRPLRRRK